MGNPAYPTVNGDECSWADLSIDFDIPGSENVKIYDIEAIKWSSKLEVGKSQGLSGRVMKTTAGSESTEASITLTRSGLRALREAIEKAAEAQGLTRGNQVIIGRVRFTILLQHTPLGDDGVYETKLSGCRYMGDSDDMSQGTDPDQIEVTLGEPMVERKSATGKDLVLA